MAGSSRLCRLRQQELSVLLAPLLFIKECNQPQGMLDFCMCGQADQGGTGLAPVCKLIPEEAVHSDACCVEVILGVPLCHHIYHLKSGQGKKGNKDCTQKLTCGQGTAVIFLSFSSGVRAGKQQSGHSWATLLKPQSRTGCSLASAN